jgi:two-component system response regulator DevR
MGRRIGDSYLRGVRVLVVDDSAWVRARLVSMLAEVRGVDVLGAPDADTAWNELQAGSFDLVILDIHMPGENGLSFLPRIKALPAPPWVVALTTDPSGHHRRECLARGAEFFFDKSKEFDRVLDVVIHPVHALAIFRSGMSGSRRERS